MVVAVHNTRQRRGFTVIELCLVMMAAAVVLAILLPKFTDPYTREKEAALKADLNLLRRAVSLYKADTGAYPAKLSDLSAMSAPKTGIDSSGEKLKIEPANWRGPYLQDIPTDALTGKAFLYGAKSPDAGKVTSSAAGIGMDGTAYRTW